MWRRILINAAIFVPIYWVLTSYLHADGNFVETLVGRIDDALIVGGIYILLMRVFEWFRGRNK